MEKSNQNIRDIIQRIEFDPLPAQDITGLDHVSVINTAKFMLSIKYPARADAWSVQFNNDTGCYEIICEFPVGISFSSIELDTIKLCNPVLIEDVIICTSSDKIRLLTRLRSITEPRSITVNFIKHIQVKISDPKIRRITQTVIDEEDRSDANEFSTVRIPQQQQLQTQQQQQQQDRNTIKRKKTSEEGLGNCVNNYPVNQ